MNEPAQLQATSIVGVIDATFRLYRAQFRGLLSGLVSMLGICIAILLMFRLGNHEEIDWTRLSPLRPEALVDAFNDIRLGLDPFSVVLDHNGDILLLLGTQAILTGLVLAALCARLLIAPQAALLEQQRALVSLRRSWQLTRGAFGRMLVAALLITAVPALLIGSLELIPYLVFASTGTIDLIEPLLTVVALLRQALLALAYVFQVAFFTLLYYDLRFRAEGYDLVLQANRTATEQARTLVERGTARLESDDLVGAQAEFEQARTFLPNDQAVLSYCIAAKLRLNDPAGALKDCEHAIELFPNEPYLLHCRGVARYRLGDLAGGQADYDRALRLYPNQVTALINRAHLKHTLGDYDSARENLLWVLRYKPGEGLAMYNIACGYARQAQADAALDWLGRAIAKGQQFRTMARDDEDFAALRDEPRFAALIGEPLATPAVD